MNPVRFGRAFSLKSWMTAALAMACLPIGAGGSEVALNLDDFDPACDVEVTQQETQIRVSWRLDAQRRGQMTFDLDPRKPLIHALAVHNDSNAIDSPIVSGLDPTVMIRVGPRDLESRGGWTIFFDRMQTKPYELFVAQIGRDRPSATSHAGRATLTIGELTAGPFRGEMRWTFYSGCPFVLQEAVVSTEKNGVAFLYDTGLIGDDFRSADVVWRSATGALQSQPANSISAAQSLAVRGRTIAAEFAQGSIALFPPPHRYFYPLDFSNNLHNIWVGPEYAEQRLPLGMGIRHDPRGDNRFVPWFNAPPGTVQQLGLFLYLTDRDAAELLKEVGRLTRHDRFAPLPGHRVFSSHYHVEHTREVLESQDNPAPSDPAPSDPPKNDPTESLSVRPRLETGKPYRLPPRLVEPGFVQVFRELGVDIVHLAEFHFGHTPQMTMRERIEQLELLHAECRRLSDDGFLLLPGEEPNVHLGGHWISFFPRPVYWVLNRPSGIPFVVEHPKLGKVYHVGGEADVLRLLRAEGGLAWTAHPRIKSSTGYPDRYRDRLFYQSDRFLGAAWKAMPADLSSPRLGSRVLDLLDDMSNWGHPKYVIGEVDVFKIEPDHELYGHMNVNYLRLDHVPRFDDGWHSVLDALRAGRFFVTTGEVLIRDFTVNGQPSGETASLINGQKARVRLNLDWTFPLSFAEIISGDGKQVARQRIDLSATGVYGQDTVEIEVDLAGQRWVRAEVWDVATNGAFTQPVWMNVSSP